MSMIDNALETFELVSNTGVPYGEIQSAFWETKMEICLKGQPPINKYDIIRRLSDNQTFRIVNLQKYKCSSEKTTLTVANLIPYNLWRN